MAEEIIGLPEKYLSPTRHAANRDITGEVGEDSYNSDTSNLCQGVWDDTDADSFVQLPAEITQSDDIAEATEFSNISVVRSSTTELVSIQERPNNDRSLDGSSNLNFAPALADSGISRSDRRQRLQRLYLERGETPGSDNTDRRVSRQVLHLDTISGNFTTTPSVSGELVFSPGGNEGIIVPGGVTAYYATNTSDSSDGTDEFQWQHQRQVFGVTPGQEDGVVQVGGRISDAVEHREMADNLLLQRNSPVGELNPNFKIVSSSHEPIRTLVPSRPPLIGQSDEALAQQPTSRTDLGATDGEESEEDIRRVPLPAMEGSGSLGSQSENTDSVNTVVMETSRGEVQGCEGADVDMPIRPRLVWDAAQPTVASWPKPNFQVGGLISPRGKYQQYQLMLRDRMQNVRASLDISPGNNMIPMGMEAYGTSLPQYSSPHDVEPSLSSMLSIESTNHPDSSERVTSPSVMSVSSAASSRRMEWDSGADLGYFEKHSNPSSASLSTLERIAIGSYASVLRTEPEGTTHARGKGGKSHKSHKHKSSGKASAGRIGGRNDLAPLTRRVILDGNLSALGTRAPPSLPEETGFVHTSSSEEGRFNYGGKYSSSSQQSPRRKPRRRSSLVAAAGDSDSPGLRKGGGTSKGRPLSAEKSKVKSVLLASTMCGEGKSSSLVELNRTPPAEPFQCQRSSSHHTLSGKPGMENSCSTHSSKDFQVLFPGLRSSVSSNSTMTNICVSSTSTLVPSVVSVTSGPVSASTSDTLIDVAQSNVATKKPVVSAPAAAESSERRVMLGYSKSWNENRNAISSSEDDHRNEKCKKDKENSGKNVSKSGSVQSDLTPQITAGSVGTLAVINPVNSDQFDSETMVAKDEVCTDPFSSFNRSLFSLAEQLRARTATLAFAEEGEVPKSHDYRKLYDYIDFVGAPSISEEECHLKQGVANVILRMFGEICLDETETSNDTLRSSEMSSSIVSECTERVQGAAEISKQSESQKEDLHHSSPSFYTVQRQQDVMEQKADSELSPCDDVWQPSELLYRDRHGKFHVANRPPPGYDRDSRLSESLSEDVEITLPVVVRAVDQGSPGESPRPWTSSGGSSESAYETIRERHRRVDEALASSFEFYSTSPRDARRLGYISSDVAAAELSTTECTADQTDGSHLPTTTMSHPDGSQQRGATSRLQQKQRVSEAQCVSSPFSAWDVSRQVSVVKIQKRRYIRNIRRHIQTLEKLERALREQLIDWSETDLTNTKTSPDAVNLKGRDRRDLRTRLPGSTNNVVSSDFSDDLRRRPVAVQEGSHPKGSIGHTDGGPSWRRWKSGRISSSSESGHVSKKMARDMETGLLSRDASNVTKEKKVTTIGWFSSSSNSQSLERIEREVSKLSRVHSQMPEELSEGCEVGKPHPVVKAKGIRPARGEAKDRRGKSTKGNKETYSCQVFIPKGDRRKASGQIENDVKCHDWKIIQSSNCSETIKPTKKTDYVMAEDLQILPMKLKQLPNEAESLESNDNLPTVTNRLRKDTWVKGTVSAEVQTENLKNDIRNASIQTGNSLLILSSQRNHSHMSVQTEDADVKIVDSGSYLVKNLTQAGDLRVQQIGEHWESVMNSAEQNERMTGDQLRISGDLKEMPPENFHPMLPVGDLKLPAEKTSYKDINMLNQISNKELTKTIDKPRVTNNIAMYVDSSHSTDNNYRPKKLVAGVADVDAMVLSGLPYDSLRNKENISKGLRLDYPSVSLGLHQSALTLQEALALARPSYVRHAEDRRQMIRLKQELRQEAQEHNQRVAAEIPANMQTPATLSRVLYRPDLQPLFSYKDIREQNRRLYQKLPEATLPGVHRQRTAVYRTNRVMASIYSQKLRKKALKGLVSHGHQGVVSPPTSNLR